MHVRVTVATREFSEQVSCLTALQLLLGDKKSCNDFEKSVQALGLPRQEGAGARFYFIMVNLPAFRWIEIETVVGC